MELGSFEQLQPLCVFLCDLCAYVVQKAEQVAFLPAPEPHRHIGHIGKHIGDNRQLAISSSGG